MTSDTHAPARSPWSIAPGGDSDLRKGDERVLLLGGQVSNSSSSSPASISESFAHVRHMHGNAVVAPVSWALSEPVEGTFDFTLVDRMLEEARTNGLHLVLLWFGAYKNAASTYAPRWVRGDRERFPAAVIEPKGKQPFTYEGAMSKPVLSVFSEALRAADAAAFVAFVHHVAQHDRDGVVAMIQVENESGILLDSRDRGPLAQERWNSPVPAELLAHLPVAPAESMARELWQEQGSTSSGTWPEVFGDDWRADEIFMAWGFATYVEHLASLGKTVLDIPMYANAWLGPQPHQDRAGQYPSGGPTSRVLDVWRLAAPSLALLGPDIYVDDADGAMRAYVSNDQPLFIPEIRPSAGELVRAIGTYRAIGWSTFGIDDANPEGQVAATLAHLVALEPELAAARSEHRTGAMVIEAGVELLELRLGDIDIVARGTLALFQKMLLDAGVRIPDQELSLPTETLPSAPVPWMGDTRPFGLVLLEDADTIVVVGQGITLDFFVEGARVEIDSVEELLVEDGRIVSGRILNGDERLKVLPTGSVGAARIRLIRV